MIKIIYFKSTFQEILDTKETSDVIKIDNVYTDYKTKDEVVKEELDIDMEVIRVEIITKNIILKRLHNDFKKKFFYF